MYSIAFKSTEGGEDIFLDQQWGKRMYTYEERGKVVSEVKENRNHEAYKEKDESWWRFYCDTVTILYLSAGARLIPLHQLLAILGYGYEGGYRFRGFGTQHSELKNLR